MTPRFPVAFRPPAFAYWASCSRRGVPLSSRSAYQAVPGPRQGFHVPHTRVTAGWGALFTPRPSGALTAGPIPPAAARPLFQGPGPITPAFIPSPGAVYYEASSRVHSRSPARPSPLPVIPGWNGDFLGLLPGLRTPAGRTCGARQGGGRASSTHPELHDRHNRTSNPQAHSQCATSCRTTGLDMTRFPTAAHLVSWAGAVPAGHPVRAAHPARQERREHLPARLPRPGRQRRRRHRHLPRRTARPHRPPPRKSQSPGRDRPLHPGHHLASAARPRSPLHRPRPRPLPNQDRQKPESPQPHPPARSPRLHRHPHQSRLNTSDHHRRATEPASPALPHAPLRWVIFRSEEAVAYASDVGADSLIVLKHVDSVHFAGSYWRSKRCKHMGEDGPHDRHAAPE